jgi:nitroreductase
MDIMDLNEAILGRRAVRQYTAQAVDDKTIGALIDAAIQAPSAVNQQSWKFTVLRDQALLDRLSRQAKAHLLATMDGGPHREHFNSMLKDEDFHIFYHAPVLILISTADEGPWVVEDCALAAENMMLAAHALGLGSCWIGFAQDYLNTAEGKQLLGLPATGVSVAPIIVGHPKAPTPPVPRKSADIRWIG